jgi:3-hydroxyacyl-CoA dehydrogenase, NAD binding domain/3-hydroxyacyl-CoA dehydrogenase, C-terminal domain/Amidohydrolase family
VFAQLGDRVAPDAIVASGSSTISPSHMVDAVRGPERFLVVHWLNPAHIIPLVEVVPGAKTAPATVERAMTLLEAMGKVPVRCADSPGFIGPRMQVLLMNEAVRLVEEGVATPEDVDRAFRAGMGFRYGAIGIFELIDWGGVDIVYRASRFMAVARGDERFAPARLVEEKIARNELGPKTGRGFFDYTGERREAFETEKALKHTKGLAAHGRFPEMLDAGIAVSLGGDSGNGSNHFDMLRLMYLAAVIFKDARLDVRVMPAELVLEMATIRGAEALRLEREIGSLEVGKRADLVLYDLDTPEWRPLLNPVNNLVYAASGASVRTVIVDGRVVLDEGRMTTVDEREIYDRVQRLAPAHIARAGLRVDWTWPAR